jgi:putative ABC transport system permease protein
LARQRELAVRSALGATRGRLVRELIAEAATMGLAAGALGAGIAVAGIQVLRTLAPPTLPRLSSIGVDGRVVAFCALTSVVAVFIFGALPALHASSGNLAAFLKEGGRSTGTGRHRRLQDGLVVLQVSVALVLLTGAGLLAESFAKFRNTDQGFSPEGVLTAEVALANERYPTADREAAFASTVVEQLAAQPGVQAASASSALPGAADIRWTFTVLGDPPPDPSHLAIARPVYVSSDYLRTMRIGLRRGRGVLPTDDRHAVKITVVDEPFVKRFFGSRDPIGQRLAFYHSPATDTLTIVGVVAAVRQGGLVGEDVPLMYMSLAQAPFPGLLAYVSLRTSGSVAGRQAGLKETIDRVDRTVPVYDIKTLNDRLIESVGLTRFSSFLASVFAVVALVLGVVGIYGVLAYVVGQRQREIAVRIALGASRARVMADVLRRALVLMVLGIAVGSGAAWVLVSTLAGLIAGVNPHDPGTFMAAAAAFSVVALAAASVPAYRTTRISPVVALTSV